MSYDSKSYDLAEAFVDDSEIIGSRSTGDRIRATQRVAQAIQTVIEDEIADIEAVIEEEHPCATKT